MPLKVIVRPLRYPRGLASNRMLEVGEIFSARSPRDGRLLIAAKRAVRVTGSDDFLDTPEQEAPRANAPSADGSWGEPAPAKEPPILLSDGETGSPTSQFHPLDHDQNGSPGGSLPAAQRGKEELYAQLDELGLEYDKRWGARRLQALIDNAQG
jgi:hypothetical protein